MTNAFSSLLSLFSGTRDLLQGVEAQLRRRERMGLGSATTALFGLVLGIGGLVADGKAVKALADTDALLTSVWRGQAGTATLVAVLGLLLFAAGAVLYVLLRWTRFLQAESREPFRYTVSIQPFRRAAAEAPAPAFTDETRIALLQHDLRERLNQRIGRFTLLDAPPAAADSARRLPHLHVAGDYVLREDRQGRWLLQVMPTVRLGAADAPVAMAYTVLFPIGPAQAPTFGPQHYEHLVERVYSSVATEIYSTIEADVRTKIRAFPTAYLRAVALHHEARDIARSNTVDAYDLALGLYAKARLVFETAPWRDGRRWWIHVPLLWRRAARYLQMRARVDIEHVRCQIYRHMTALQTGRRPNPIYECVWRMDRVVEDLHWVHSRLIEGDGRQHERAVAARAFFSFPADRFLRRLLRRPLEAEFEDLRRVLFDARTVAALASAQLGAVDAARQHLGAAAAVDPALAEVDAVYLVARAEIEAQPRLRARLLRRASELAPKFQIAQYRLAKAVELDFRQEGELNAGRVSNVMQVYDEVLRLNPGNLAAIAAQGYLHWLMSDLPAAEQRFRDGLAFKTIVRDTAAPELHYGLARVLAETGADDEAYDQYAQAVAGDRDVAAWTTGVGKGLSSAYYVYIDTQVVARYRRYCDAVVQRRSDARVPAVVRATIDSMAWNDVANALLNDYFRNGRVEQLDAAGQAIERALGASPTNSVAHFNLASLHEFRRHQGAGHPITLAIDAIDRAVMLAPNWTTARDRQVELALDSWTLGLIGEDIEKARGSERPVDKPWIHPAGAVAPQAPGSQQLARRLDEIRRTYDKRLGRFFEDLTRESRLRELLVPADGDNDVGRWFDNALALADAGQHIRLERFDSGDVQALSALVRFTTQRALNRLRPPAGAGADDASALPDDEKQRLFGELRRARDLLVFIVERFLPADFDLRVASLKIADALGEARPEAAQRIIGETVLFWTQEDPWHFWALEQWLSWLDLDQTKALAEALLRSRDCDPARLLKVGRQLYELARHANESELRDHRFGRLKELAALCVNRQPELAEGYFLLAEALVDEGSASEAMNAYASATRFGPQDGRAPKGMLALSRAQAQRSDRHEAAIVALRALAASGGGTRHVTRQLRRLAGYDLQRQNQLPPITPIAIEAATDLVPLIATADQSELLPSLASETEALRNELRRQWGVPVPGFRFRGNDGGLSAGSYILMIDEVPLLLGRVEAGLQFWLPDEPSAAERLDSVAADPLTGRPGAWLPEPLPAELAGVPALRFAPMSVVLRQLRALLERNLAGFLGHDELDALIAGLDASVRDALPADERTPLLLALRSLLGDGVPVAALAAIVSAWPQLRATTPQRAAQVEALRRLPELAASLPGNDGAHRLLRLGERFAAALRAGLVGDAAPVLALDPERCQQMLTVLRSTLPADLGREPAALVVDDAALRRHLARLTRLEFPALPVLSVDELGPAAAASPMATIDLEATS